MKNKIFFIIVSILLACTGCKKEEIAPIAKVEVTDVLIDASYRKADVHWRVASNATAEAVVFEYSTDPTFEKAVKVAMNRVSAYYSDNPFYGVSIDSLQDGTKYYARSIVYNKINSCASAAQVFKTKPYELADISTDSITGITVSSAKLHATMREWGTDIRPQFGFCIATHDSVSIADSCIVYPLTAHKASTAYVVSLSNLADNTTYYVRAYAKNIKGVAYGEKLSFTTFEIGMPQVGNTTISDITSTTAKAASQVLSDGGSKIIERGICYSTSSNPTTSANKIANGSGQGSFTCDLTNLIAGTTYHVRAYAINNKGTSYGEETSFTTTTYGIPVLTTSAATNISYTTATCGGNITSDGGQTITERGVCYSISQSPTTSDDKIAGGEGMGIFTCNITNLTAGTTYYVRAYATNSKGTSYGNEVSISTTAYGLPAITTTTVFNISYTTATCGGSVTEDGGLSVTDRGFCYYTSPNPTIGDNKVASGNGTGPFTCKLEGLSDGTTYYVRAYATNSKGTAYGEEITFSTAAYSLPAVTTSTATNIGYTTVTCGGNVTTDGVLNVIERGVCYSTSQNPTIENSKVTSGSGSGSFTCNITGLVEGATYYVRAYATNSKGTAYGENKSFTTNTVPSGAIHYKSDSKLPETINKYDPGLHTNAFGNIFGYAISIASHTYSNGEGIIEFSGLLATVGDYAFYGCNSLTSVTIPNNVTSISIGYRTFWNCTGLASVIINNSVTSIGEESFLNCSGLTTIEFPNSVTSIGNRAFSSCTGLTSISCVASTPPTCGMSCFYNVDKSIPVYVPASSIDAYKQATGWKDFTNILPINE